jgi:TrmH family RNA methyltransferase
VDKSLSRQERKIIKSLSVKKYRDTEGLFVVEGEKCVREFLNSLFIIRKIYHTGEFDFACRDVDAQQITPDNMQQISNLKTASSVLAIVEIPKTQPEAVPRNELILALDDIQDPGNLGTIIRLADWFGINHIVCSPFTADAYSPKAVQATMGSLTRVSMTYTDLREFLESAGKEMPVYGTFLFGENIYVTDLSCNGIIVMGSEGKGVSPEVERLVSRKLTIPSFSLSAPDSLNVAVATSIILSEFKRRIL